MKQYKIALLVGLFLKCPTYASTSIENELTKDDIQKSISRCYEAFRGDYHPQPIFDPLFNSNVGKLQYNKATHQVLITFRGSAGSGETFSNFSSNAEELYSHFNIAGKGHEILLKSYDAMKQLIFNGVRACAAINEDKDLSELDVMIEGHSRGGGLASYTALGMFSELELSPNKIKVITYGGVNILDIDAANAYNQTFAGQHLSFKAEEDTIPNLTNGAGIFQSLGKQILFSAAQSQNYRDRVASKAFTHLDPQLKPYTEMLFNPNTQALAGGILSLFKVNLPNGIREMLSKGITINNWEAHMPETYLELSSLAFQHPMSTEARAAQQIYSNQLATSKSNWSDLSASALNRIYQSSTRMDLEKGYLIKNHRFPVNQLSSYPQNWQELIEIASRGRNIQNTVPEDIFKDVCFDIAEQTNLLSTDGKDTERADRQLRHIGNEMFRRSINIDEAKSLLETLGYTPIIIFSQSQRKLDFSGPNQGCKTQ